MIANPIVNSTTYINARDETAEMFLYTDGDYRADDFFLPKNACSSFHALATCRSVVA